MRALKGATPSFPAIPGVATTAQLPAVQRLWTSDCSAHAISSGTAEVVLKTFSVTAANVSIAANSVILVRAQWTYTNSGNNKTMRVRIGAAGAGTGGTAMSTMIATTSATSGRDTVIYVRGTSSQLSNTGGLFLHEGLASGAMIAAAIDLTANWEIALTGQPASGGETVQLEAASLELIVP